MKSLEQLLPGAGGAENFLRSDKYVPGDLATPLLAYTADIAVAAATLLVLPRLTARPAAVPRQDVKGHA